MKRRSVLAGAVAIALFPCPARAADYVIDWQGLPPDPAVAARITRQIAMVRALPIDPAILAFFERQTIHVNKSPGEGSRAGREPGVFITRDPFPDDNPVLLHELIHRWHFDTLANTPAVQPVRQLFARERANPHWPAQAYMYSNISEFLAMTASVVLYGRAARPPFRRAAVKRDLPDLYQWIVTRFALRLPGESR